MLEYIPTVIQVIPYEDYTVDVYFDDGKIVCCHAEKDLSPNIFDRIKAYHIFMNPPFRLAFLQEFGRAFLFSCTTA